MRRGELIAPRHSTGAASQLQRLRRAMVLAGPYAVSVVMLGCAKPPAPPPKPKFLTIEVHAAPNVNPDARGRPSPIVVRIYELKGASSFENADFMSLQDKDQSVLGADMVVRDEFVLTPGNSRSIRREAAESKFLGVMAAFRDLERAHWRAVSPLVLGRDNAFAIQLEASSVQLSKR